MSTTESPLGPPPRRARFRRGIRNVRRGYRTLFALVILVFGGWALLDGLRLGELTYRTLKTNGTITRKEAIARNAPASGAAARSYRLSYVFTAKDGTAVSAAAPVSAEVYEAAVEHGPCVVVYLPDHPSESWLNDNEAARSHPRFMMICRGLLALLALVVLFWIERPLRRELLLARRGVVAQGKILATGMGRRRRARAWIAYTFCTASGAMVEGRCVVPRSTPADQREPGTMIEVLYHPRRPRLNKARLGLDFVEFV
jgi:hypothetical protein